MISGPDIVKMYSYINHYSDMNHTYISINVTKYQKWLRGGYNPEVTHIYLPFKMYEVILGESTVFDLIVK